MATTISHRVLDAFTSALDQVLCAQQAFSARAAALDAELALADDETPERRELDEALRAARASLEHPLAPVVALNRRRLEAQAAHAWAHFFCVRSAPAISAGRARA